MRFNDEEAEREKSSKGGLSGDWKTRGKDSSQKRPWGGSLGNRIRDPKMHKKKKTAQRWD